MSERVVLVSFWRPRDAWYYAEPDARRDALASWEGVWDQARSGGATQLTTGSTRASSKWARVSVWDFPSLQALMDVTERLEESGYTEYLEVDNMLVTPESDPFAPYLEAADHTATVMTGVPKCDE